jgi:hypothetical protein
VDGLRLYLDSVPASVPAGDVLDDPMLAAPVVEDTCSRIAHAGWFARRPRRRQYRRMRRWQAERMVLREQRDQVRALARRCGLVVV